MTYFVNKIQHINNTKSHENAVKVKHILTPIKMLFIITLKAEFTKWVLLPSSEFFILSWNV